MPMKPAMATGPSATRVADAAHADAGDCAAGRDGGQQQRVPVSSGEAMPRRMTSSAYGNVTTISAPTASCATV